MSTSVGLETDFENPMFHRSAKLTEYQSSGWILVDASAYKRENGERARRETKERGRREKIRREEWERVGESEKEEKREGGEKRGRGGGSKEMLLQL